MFIFVFCFCVFSSCSCYCFLLLFCFLFCFILFCLFVYLFIFVLFFFCFCFCFCFCLFCFLLFCFCVVRSQRGTLFLYPKVYFGSALHWGYVGSTLHLVTETTLLSYRYLLYLCKTFFIILNLYNLWHLSHTCLIATVLSLRCLFYVTV